MEPKNIFKWKHYQPDIILLVLLQKSDRMKDARLSHNSHLSAEYANNVGKENKSILEEI